MQKTSEEHIIELCKQGNPQGKKALYEMFSSKMLALCYRYVGNKQDAEDAMIDGFIAVYENIDTFVYDNLQGWINRIMINSSLTLMRNRKRFLLQEDDTVFEKEDDTEIDNPQRFSKQDIMNALQTLSPTEKTVFNMSVIDGYSHDYIAQSLNIKKTSLKTTLCKAKIKLRNYLESLDK